ncbi:MAG: 7-cyano-7-deazaguanine synthase [Isosphaeraceae bacterium]
MNMNSIAILISGGLDSAILLGDAVQTHKAVHPLYVRNGLVWEDVEQDYLRRFLDAVRCPTLRPLQVLDLPANDLFPGHWSFNGQGVPDADSPDEAVFIPARNVLLLAKAILWCHLRKVPAVALGTLGSNPFADATPAFFVAFQTAVNLAVGGSVQVHRPYAELTKLDVMRLGQGLPLQLTFSCIRPLDGRHCGACNKCQERRLAFQDAGLVDPTEYRYQSMS